MSKMYHLAVDIRGFLLNNKRDRDFKGVFTHDNGQPMSADQARNALMDELAKGHKVIPTCPCEGFDYQHGCPGHDVPDEATGV